jgi:hypothetical protein
MILLPLLCFLHLGALDVLPASSPDLTLLPPDGFLQTWKMSERVRVFTSADLYGHIDGGAELFLEFGFEQLTVQLYTPNFRPSRTPKQENELQVEVYRMTDPIAAAGVYLLKCGNESLDPSFRERHAINKYQLLFKRYRYLVIVNNVEGDEGIQPAMLDFARFIASRLPAEKPLLLDESLPKKGKVKDSLRLIRGPYALQSLYTLGEGDILQLRRSVTAVSARYGDANGKRTVILADYPNEQAARGAFLHVQSNLDGYLKVEAKNEHRLVFKDYAGEWGVISLAGRRLMVEVHLSKKPA